MKLGDDVHLETIANECKPGFTGADFYALVSDAQLCAVKEQVQQIEQNAGIEPQGLPSCSSLRALTHRKRQDGS